MEKLLDNFLKAHKICAQIIKVYDGKFVNYIDLKVDMPSTYADVARYSVDLGLLFKSLNCPRVYPIWSEGLVRIEYVSKSRPTIPFNYDHVKEPMDLFIGTDVSGETPVILDLKACPHLLVAGSTQSGKSVILHNIICSLLKFKDNINVTLIDPKEVEFNVYNNLVMRVDSAISTDIWDYFQHLLNERLSIFKESGARNIEEYNSIISETKMPYEVLVIDELADLMVDKSFTKSLLMLSQKCRAAGINIVVATQRPSVDIISGSIKANFPARIACRVPTKMDSKVILDVSGAETLMGKGDALIIGGNYPHITRLQAAYQSHSDILNLYNTKEPNRHDKKIQNFLSYVKNIPTNISNIFSFFDNLVMANADHYMRVPNVTEQMQVKGIDISSVYTIFDDKFSIDAAHCEFLIMRKLGLLVFNHAYTLEELERSIKYVPFADGFYKTNKELYTDSYKKVIETLSNTIIEEVSKDRSVCQMNQLRSLIDQHL